MLLAKNVVGNQQDWAQFITLSDEHETPMLDTLSVGDKPVNVLYQYQADTYDTPAPVAIADGQDWTSFKSAGANRVELKSRVQWFRNTCAVSKLAQDVTNAAGVKDELAREIPKKLKEMARTIECVLGSEQVAYEDDGANGNQTQGMGRWIQSDATSQLYATPASVRPASASILAATMANTTESAVRTVLQSMWTATGRSGRLVGYVGPKMKTRFADFTLYVPSSVSTQSTTTTNQRSYESRRYGQMVDVYASDFGTLELHMSPWLDHVNFGGTAAKGYWKSYFIHPDMWEIRWNQKPNVYKPEFQGGSYKAAMDTILMLVCKNPIGEAKSTPSDAA